MIASLCHTVKECYAQYKMVSETLDHAGLLVNEDKSHWEISQCGKWLGFDIDLPEGKIAVLKEKVELLGTLSVLLSQREVQPKLLASIIGRIIAMSLGVGSLARLHTRSLCIIKQQIIVVLKILSLMKELKQNLILG